VQLGKLDPFLFFILKFSPALLFLQICPFWIFFLENAKEELLMLLEGAQLVQVLVDFTPDVLHFGVKLLDLGLFRFSIFCGRIGLLITV